MVRIWCPTRINGDTPPIFSSGRYGQLRAGSPHRILGLCGLSGIIPDNLANPFGSSSPSLGKGFGTDPTPPSGARARVGDGNQGAQEVRNLLSANEHVLDAITGLVTASRE